MDMWVNGEQLGTMDVDPELGPFLGAPGVPYYLVVGGSSDGEGNILNPLDGEITVAQAYSTPLTDIEMARIAHEAQPAIDHVLPAVRAVSTPATTGTTGLEFTLPALESVDDSGVVAEMSITVIGPWGDEVVSTTGAAGVFTPAAGQVHTRVHGHRRGQATTTRGGTP